MLDFMRIATRYPKRDVVEIYPKFIIKKSSDLMIRGGDFYAIWDEERKTWSTDEEDVRRLVDRELDIATEKYKKDHPDALMIDTKYMWDADSGIIDKWHKYCQKQMRDSYRNLDEKLIFANHETKKEDYSSKKLPYPLEPGDISGYEKLVSTLYLPEERHKLEWAIGAVVDGASKHIQKFCVFYGEGGTGKSTILNIILKLFDGYETAFDAKALGSSNNTFALEAFKSNPIVAVQHDGDLSKIEDNTIINSLVSHETMRVNEKFKPSYPMRFNAFLFMGTNKPVKITDGKSGIIRRLIDISPSGNKLPRKEYTQAVKQVDFELGAIAHHCLQVYCQNPGKYDDYMPLSMLGASNDFYNFVLDAYHVFKKDDGTTLKAAWEMYKTYCEEAKVPYPYSQRTFKEELKNYFWEYKDRFNYDDGSRVRSFYSRFRTDKFERKAVEEEDNTQRLIEFNCTESIFDKERADCYAQYATNDETPSKKWEKVKTKLSGLDTSRLHYVKVPENHIVIDFDIKDESGKKSFELNVKEASKWPPTYAELSKSGAGVHLHYIYTGDPSKLSRVYDDNIEVKVFTGKSSLRRKLTKCNDLPITTISSGLPLKGEDKMVNYEAIKNEKMLRALIKKNLNKEVHASTKCSIDFINKLLNDAYNSGMKYDVTDMENAVIAFAIASTNQSDYCLKLVGEMPFKSDEPSTATSDDAAPIVFVDVEVFPNLFLVNWKFQGEGKPVVRMINPTPAEIEELLRYNLIGFNNRGYDNHMLYGRLLGYDNEQMYKLSTMLVSNDRDISKNAKFGEAYNLSYTDVYDFASAGNKMGLKKWEIKLGIHHQELGLPWDQPVPKSLWNQVAEYCDNDVIATEAVFNHLSADWTARQILADLAGMTVNDTTNTLTTRIIFGNNKKPQNEFRWRNMAEPVKAMDIDMHNFLEEAAPEMMAEPHGEAKSLLPYFPGYEYKFGKSTYRGEEVGEGGYVYAEPGIHTNVALLDVTSMHPHSIIAECYFGPRFTRVFREVVYGRVDIKHEAWDEVNNILGGKLAPYIQKVLDGELSSKDLANGLKTAINAVYGQTFAGYDNPFKDPRNKDNIVAKRGALFMVDLKHAVQERGFTVAHIKTDSIKIPNATPEIIEFVMEFGKRYGYTFEHEATYEKMCLVNDAVYIAKYENGGEWTATGTQFAVPYVFKKLFSREPIEFEDLCETKQVKSAMYLDMNEKLEDVTIYEKELDKLEKNKKKGIEPLPDRMEELEELIAHGHNYNFVGRVGQFCPMKEGSGGGVLLRENGRKENGVTKYGAVTGCKGYRWMETEKVRVLGKEDDIDRSYYDKLVDDAFAAIAEHGDAEWFISDDPYIKEETPPWE